MTHSDMVDPPARLWQLSSWLLNQVAARANRIVGEQFGRPGGRMRYAILAGLDQYGTLSQAELGRRLGIDPSDLVAALKDMEADGLVRRMPHPADRRRNAVRVTDQGTRALAEMDEIVGTAQDRFLDPLDPAERDQLNELLRRLLNYPYPGVVATRTVTERDSY